jgi:metallo-beta-lactamase family protein
MKLSFFGAAMTVTGSKYLLEHEGKKYLIDCGLFQGLKELRLRNWQNFPVEPATIESVILTHAHIDHSGYLPILVKQGFRGTIYATRATFDLCKILLPDSGRIQEEDARNANRKGYSKHKPALPLYTEIDAYEALKKFKTFSYDEEIELTPSLSFHYTRAGHILGSSFVSIKSKTKTIVFSGDIGRSNDPLMKPPESIHHADFLVLESTYGSRLHPKIDVKEKLASLINKTLAAKGSIIIPAFAVGRAQTLLYLIYKLKLEKLIPDYVPVYLDSPMAQNATDLLCKYSNEHNLTHRQCLAVSNSAKYTQTPEDSKKINQNPVPSIIISASGMAEGGRVLYHIKFYGSKPENLILFVGFQAKGTRGDTILQGGREVKIHGEIIPIRAKAEMLDSLSSHADYEEILAWLKKFSKAPQKVFLTHGEPDAIMDFKTKIEETLSWDVYMPSYLETFTIDESID